MNLDNERKFEQWFAVYQITNNKNLESLKKYFYDCFESGMQEKEVEITALKRELEEAKDLIYEQEREKSDLYYFAEGLKNECRRLEQEIKKLKSQNEEKAQ